MTETDELKSQIAALEERVAQLEARGRPAAPFKAEPAPLRDLTAGMSMPKEALQAMVDAVPSATMREIAIGDRVRAELAPLASGFRPTVAQLNRSGSRSPSPLSNPPGVALADKLMDVADARDKAELIEKEARRLAQTKADNAA